MLTPIEDLKSDRAKKALEIIGDLDEPIQQSDLNLDFYRKHFSLMIQNLTSENYEKIVISIHFFKSYVILAKNRDFVEYFLRYSGSLGHIITLFLKHEVPLVVEESLDLLLCIYMYVSIDFNPKDLEEIAERCVYLFSNGTYSLNILLLDFIYHVCQRESNFSHLIIENDAFDKSIVFLLGDCDKPTKLIKRECRTFDTLIDQPFDENFIPDVMLKIFVYFDYPYNFSHCTALSMLGKMIDHGLNISDYPSIYREIFVKLSAAPQKVLLQLLKTIQKIKDKSVINDIISCEDFRNNLAIQCIDMKVGSKARAKIFKLFAKYVSLYRPEPRGIIIVAAFQSSLSSYIEKRHVFNYFDKLCENGEFAIEFAFAGALTLLSYSLADAAGEVADKIFNILGLIGHSFFVAGRDLRCAQDYETIAIRLSELNGDEDADVNHETISALQKFYYSENDNFDC